MMRKISYVLRKLFFLGFRTGLNLVVRPMQSLEIARFRDALYYSIITSCVTNWEALISCAVSEKQI